MTNDSMNNNSYTLTKKRFLENHKFENQSHLIFANDSICLDNDDTKVYLGVYFKVILTKKEDDLQIKINLYSWSNKKQSLVGIDKSIWSDSDFGSGKYLEKIKKHYKNIAENLLLVFNKLKYFWQLKEILYRINNPTFIFHYKLLNSFSKTILEEFYTKNFSYYPILNIEILKNRSNNLGVSNLFLPNYIEGLYIDGLEISVDLDDSDFAVIEYYGSDEDKDKFMKKLGLIYEK